MIKITDLSRCCGCTACASICSHNAIVMQPDALGFLYPEVDKDKCVDCGLCEKVCAFNNRYDTSMNFEEPIAYGARHKDINEVETSRSGAAFIAISDYILEQGGVVYGAGYTGHFRVVHKRATTKKERDEFKGSKYVQSDMNTVFRQVKNDLRNGLMVLFSGTPCQTAGLNSYVGRQLRQNLWLIDIICDGVPSPRFYFDYISSVEAKFGNITSFCFRDKSILGWASHKESYIVRGKKHFSNKYTYVFCRRILSRKSCGRCPYTNMKRPSDITLADFWGFEKTCSWLNSDNKGISLLLINTDKGCKLVDNISGSIDKQIVNLEHAIQPNLLHTHPLSKRAEKCYSDYVKYGYRYVMFKYGEKGILYYYDKIMAKIKK